MNLVKRRTFMRLTISVAAFSLLAFLYWLIQPTISPVDARTLLAQASNISQGPADAEQVSHVKYRIFQRANPKAVEPGDPYHKPVLQLYSEYSVVDVWSRGGAVKQQRTTGRDAHTGLLLFDQVSNDNYTGSYHAANGYASVTQGRKDSPASTTTQSTSQPGQPNLQLVGTTTSAWGKPAQILRAQHSPPSRDQLEQNMNVSLPFQRPYTSDLNIDNIEQTWVIDRESGRMVRYTEQAVTRSGSVLLQEIDYEPSEVKPLASMPADWLSFPPKGVPLQNGGGAEHSRSTKKLLLKEAQVWAGFTIFLPDADRFGLSMASSDFRTPVTPKDVWNSVWKFDIEDASQYGLTLQTIYTPGAAGTTSKAVALAQGPRELLVPLMQQTEPSWTESHPVRATVEGQEVTTWIATGGPRNNPPKRIVAMLEVENTFLFLVGQDYSEAEVLDIVESLHSTR